MLTKQKHVEKHMWTKDEISLVIKLWSSESVHTLAKKLGVNYQQLNYIAKELRKNGFPMPKKHSKGQIGSLIAELKREHNIQ